jgi:O-antigen/teichoic acid export membrane protein
LSVEAAVNPERASVGESLTRGALANFSAQPITWGASLLVATLAPRLLGSHALGQYAIAISISTMAATVLALGIPEYLTRRVAQRPANAGHEVGVAVVVQVLTALLGGLIIAILAPLIAPSLVDFRLVDVVLVGTVVASGQITLLAALRGREQHARYAWLNACQVACTSLAPVLVLIAGGDVVAYAVAGVVALAGATLFNWMVSGFRVARPALDLTLIHDARALIRGGVPFFTWNLTLALYGGVDRVLLGAFVASSEVGWYTAAYRIVGMAVFVPTLLATPLFPVLSRSTHDEVTLRRTIANTLRLALVATVPISAGTIVVAPVVPVILGWPADFGNAVPLMMILSLHLPIVAVDMLFGTVIMAIGRERRWVRVGLMAAAFNILANLVCIPLFERSGGNGAIGASIVTVLTEVAMFLGALRLIPANLLDARIGWSAAKIVCAGAASGVVGIMLLPVPLPLCVVGAAAVYFVVAVWMGVLTSEDLQYARHRLSAGRR